MNYLAIFGRQPEISTAELEALDFHVQKVQKAGTFNLTEVESDRIIDINRLGGTQKLAILLEKSPLETMLAVPEGKITFGISDFSPRTAFLAQNLKRQLQKQGRSVRIVESRTGVLSTATSLHNGLSGQNPRKFEFIHFKNRWYRLTGVQDIDAYAKRDQNRPARDPKIGMLPPKLGQVLLNLASALPPHSKILDPFCGTGVVLQEALLMNYDPYGTDLDPRMIAYAKKNLTWLEGEIRQYSFSAHSAACWRGLARRPREDGRRRRGAEKDVLRISPILEVADARNHQWQKPIDAIVTEGYLGKPFARIPSTIEVKRELLNCKALILGFLKNLAPQIAPATPVIFCAPAWLRENRQYLRLNILDDIENLGYNVSNKTREGLLYYREGQIVARDIIILRKK